MKIVNKQKALRTTKHHVIIVPIEIYVTHYDEHSHILPLGQYGVQTVNIMAN